MAIALVAGMVLVVFVALLQTHRRLGETMERLGSLRALEGRRHLTLRAELDRLQAQIRAAGGAAPAGVGARPDGTGGGAERELAAVSEGRAQGAGHARKGGWSRGPRLSR